MDQDQSSPAPDELGRPIGWCPTCGTPWPACTVSYPHGLDQRWEWRCARCDWRHCEFRIVRRVLDCPLCDEEMDADDFGDHVGAVHADAIIEEWLTLNTPLDRAPPGAIEERPPVSRQQARLRFAGVA